MLLRVKNWAKYQSFNRRRPEWIKLHHKMIYDGKFKALPVESRALLPIVWLVASEFANGEITLTHEDLAARLGWPLIPYLEAMSPLFDAGFLSPDQENADDFLIHQRQVIDSKAKPRTNRGKHVDSLITRSNKDSENQSLRDRESNNRDSESLSSNKQNLESASTGLFGDDDASQGDATALAVEHWNEMAGKVGLPKVQRVTGPRRAKIIARLKDAGGMEGWRRMLALVAASDWLCGRTDRSDWRCGLDFVLTPGKFTKIMEGGYENSGKNGHGAAKPKSKIRSVVDELEDAIRERREAAAGRARGGWPDDLDQAGDSADDYGTQPMGDHD